MQVNHFEQIRIQARKPGSGGRRLSRTDFTGQQSGATVIDEKLQPRLNLFLSGVFE